jgi:hypothetical protein
VVYARNNGTKYSVKRDGPASAPVLSNNASSMSAPVASAAGKGGSGER